MLRQVVGRSAALRHCVLREARRNIGLSAVVAQKAKLDPIQEIFVNKIKDYATKSKAAGGKLVDATPEQEARFKAESERIDKMFDAAGKDMTKFPVFNFTDPTLEPVGIDTAELAMKEPGAMPVIEVDEAASAINPEIPYNY